MDYDQRYHEITIIGTSGPTVIHTYIHTYIVTVRTLRNLYFTTICSYVLLSEVK